MERIGLYAKYAGSLISRLYLLPIYYLSGFFPRDWSIWVFGSWGGHRYSDNAAAYFEYCHRAIPGRARLVWISRKRSIVSALRARGFEAHWVWSPAGIASCLRAKVYLFDSFSKDINTWLSRGAVKINLWSGVPLKKCEREIDTPGNRYYRLFHGSVPERLLLSAMMPWHAIRPDFVIATSELTRQITCKSFDVPEEKVWITGYPRNDVLVSPDASAGNDIGHLPAPFAAAIAQQKEIFLYLPTYRDSGRDFIDIDWQALDELMGRSNAVFFFKFHPDHKGGFSGSSRHVVELPKAVDVYSLLRHTSALISDYSSIIFDYMLLGSPIVYYVPDLDEFAASSRSLNFQPEEVAVGPLCRNSSELLSALASLSRDGARHETARDAWARVRLRFNAYEDGRFCRRVLEAMVTNIPGCAFLRESAQSVEDRS